MIIADTERLIIRNWQDRDRALFHEINSDPGVMEFFGFVRSLEQSDELFDRLQRDINETGYGFYALEERASVPASALPASPAPILSHIFRREPSKSADGWQNAIGEKAM